ncbi:hypothetical protein K474DRAFT_1662748 [Panus rudis PR-1116 ss-1]|nr:hypothetical protein K474DRAFT_1662748 [Panus rudis PR-1116 ss-1]
MYNPEDDSYPESESNQSSNGHPPPTPLLRCLTYIATKPFIPDFARAVIFDAICKNARTFARHCFGQRNNDVTPASQLATICAESGLIAVAQFFQTPENAERFNGDTDLVSKLFGSCPKLDPE